ncbi:MAG: sodium:solute symporter family protein [Pseudomonadota bacterium]
MTELLPFGPGAWLFISLYIGSLLLFGWLGFRARRENTLHDFYVAGPGFGFVVLVLTLYATQYSGNSLFGFTGSTYRMGYAWVLSVHFMLSIVVFYLLFAVQLQRLAKQRGYVTPGDFVRERFNSKVLNLIVAIIMIAALSNYLLAQLMAMGRALQGLAGPHGDVAYQYGVIILALIMVIYGTLGGIRAVAWSDMVQGLVLLVGFLLLLVILADKFGPLSLATDKILAEPSTTHKITPPDAARMREWLSYILIVGIGGALYPQAIQRIYAARSEIVLRRSLAVMAFLPFLTVFIAVIAGIYAIAYVPGLEGASTDQVLGRLFRLLQEDSLLGYWFVVILFAAVLSAIMSTADSALLSISSMLTKDIYGQFINSNATEAELTRLGKIFSWGLLACLVLFAILLKDQTSLVRLLDRKFDLLVQLGPAFMLGIRWAGLHTMPVLIGLVIGLIISLTLAFGPFEFVQGGKVWGIHPGLFGFAVNLVIAVSGSIYLNRRDKLQGGHNELAPS